MGVFNFLAEPVPDAALAPAEGLALLSHASMIIEMMKEVFGESSWSYWCMVECGDVEIKMH